MEPNLTPSSSSGSNPSCQILPPLSIRSGNYDRAWNDPPVFSLEVNGTVKSVPTKLNKRVAYPGISSSPTPAASGSVTSGPLPPLTSIPPTKVDFIRSFSSPGSSPDEDGQVATVNAAEERPVRDGAAGVIQGDEEAAKQRLLKLLQERLNTEPRLEDSVQAEVTKRLEVMNSKWNSLPSEVRVKLCDLGDLLEVGDYKAANLVQLELSSDFMAHCGQWIMALKHIVRKNLP